MPQPPVGARDVSYAELRQHGYREEGVRSLLFANGGKGEAEAEVEAQSHMPRTCLPYKVLRLNSTPIKARAKPTEAEVSPPHVNTPLQQPLHCLYRTSAPSTAPLHICTSAPLHLCASAPLRLRLCR